MNSIPLVNQDDEVMVKAPDGSWKMFRAGQLVDMAPVGGPPTLVTPPPIVVPPPVALVQRPVVRTPVNPGQRVSVMDITPPHITVGPVQELRTSIEDYMRLAATPAQRVQRIKEKIAILEKEEYAKRLEGIAAWKMSEVFALYVLLGQESVLGGVSIEDTIAKRKAAGAPVITVEDFQEITKLNNEIRN